MVRPDLAMMVSGADLGIRHRFRTVVLLISCQLSVGCSINDPSTVSIELETEVVPKIIKWSKTGNPSIKFSSVFGSQPIDAVCVVPDYNCIDKVESDSIANVKNYHSSFGKCVPEGSSAIMVVNKDTAHAALAHMNFIYFDISFAGACVDANSAVLNKKGAIIGVPVIQLAGR